MSVRKMDFTAGLAAALLLTALPNGSRAEPLTDLEERIAELEATTARKGNRKVSLKISGWVNEAVFFWDDGVERNVYVGTDSLEQDRFRFVGEAPVATGWKAGYILEVGINGAPSNRFSQTNVSGQPNNNALSVRKASWFVKSEQVGRILVGQDALATFHLLDDIDFTMTRNVSDYEAVSATIGQFRTRSGGVLGNSWVSFMSGFNNSSPGQSARRNIVRYDTPTFANFTASAAWGEDDVWDIALSYKGDLGDFKISGRIGYGESTDSNPTAAAGACKAIAAKTAGNCEWWGVGGTIQHVPTGLFVYAGYGEQTVEVLTAALDDESETFFVQAGIERAWLPFGKTNIFAEYRTDNVGVSTSANSSDLEFIAAGVAQHIESAETTLYALYRHADGDVKIGAAETELDAFDVVVTGVKIDF